MPIIEFDGVTKDDVIEKTIVNFDGKLLDDYLGFLFTAYGYRKDTFLSYLCSSYGKYIDDKIIVVNDYLSKDDIHKLRESLNEDFYFSDEFRQICESVGIPFEKMTRTYAKEVGYRKFGKYFVSLRYNSLKDYFTYLIKKNDVFKRNDYVKYWNNITFNTILLNMKHDLDIFEYQPGEYISFERFSKVSELNKEDIVKIKDDLKKRFAEKQYFTMKYAKQNGFHDCFEEYDFKDCFYKSIFTKDDDVQVISVNNTLIFALTEKQFTYVDLIEDIMCSVEVIGRYDLEDLLLDDYGIKLELYELKNAIEQIGGYYCDTMEKFYVIYDLYLEDI